MQLLFLTTIEDKSEKSKKKKLKLSRKNTSKKLQLLDLFIFCPVIISIISKCNYN